MLLSARWLVLVGAAVCDLRQWRWTVEVTRQAGSSEPAAGENGGAAGETGERRVAIWGVEWGSWRGAAAGAARARPLGISASRESS
jgi:hypothetical protein